MILDYSYLGFVWLVVGLIFLLAELSTPGLFLFIAFALGAGVASIFSFLEYSFMVQCLVFLVGFGISFWALRYFVKYGESKRFHTNVDALNGKTGVVIKNIKKNGKGLVKVGGEIWTAQGVDGSCFEKDDIVKIVSVKGSRLIVK